MGTLLNASGCAAAVLGGRGKIRLEKNQSGAYQKRSDRTIGAALGRRRDDSLEDLNRLRFGVRVDQEGELLHDFHMVRGTKSSYVTTRDYQSDAVYLAGVESSDEEFLKRLEEALHRPAFPLYLARGAPAQAYPAFVPGNTGYDSGRGAAQGTLAGGCVEEKKSG